MKKGNLLLIDDEVNLLEKTAMLLEDVAEEVFTCDSGQEGLKVLASNNIHCIICDINMPEMNGVEVIKKVRETHPDLPFIFYTGHGSREFMKEAIKYGAFDFIDKPNLDGLEEITLRALELGVSGSDENKGPTEFLSEYKKLLE